MGKGGFAALEAVGMVITALAVQTVIRGPLDQDSELLWGIFNWVPGGLGGQVILLGFIALVAMMSGGWADIRRETGQRTSQWFRGIPQPGDGLTPSGTTHSLLRHHLKNTETQSRAERMGPVARSGTGPHGGTRPGDGDALFNHGTQPGRV